MKKYIVVAAVMLTVCVRAAGQSGTNSPYSQYGLGLMADGATGFNKGMGGIGTAVSRSGYVNTLNPASYASIDSLTFVFDIGLSGQLTNFKEGSTRLNARNANIEYLVGAFRLMNHVGMSFGVMPYTNIGYNYAISTRLDNDASTIVTETYNGEGGLHRAYIGAGWEARNMHIGRLKLGNLRLGANVAYIWGSYSRSVSSSSSGSTSINAIAKTYAGVVNSYGVDFGLQWQLPVTASDALTLGGTLGLGHKLGTDPTCTITNTNSVTGEVDDSVYTAKNALATPMTYAVGLSWAHGNTWLVGADVELQQWGKVDIPQYDQLRGVYEAKGGLLRNSTRVRLGAEWLPSAMSRSYLQRIRYRVGASYATSYCKIKGAEGPRELSLTVGFGLPIQNMWSGRSTLNISGAWIHSSAKDMITENGFRINLGITFNERWFQKWKVQ